MPQPYSYDLRKKVIHVIEVNGISQSEASKYFKISRQTIYRLPVAKKKDG